VLEALLLGFAAAFGFAASGMASTLYQFVTKRPVAFAAPSGGAGRYALTLLGFAITGPYIMMRAAFNARFVDHRSWGMVGIGLSIALMWSICSGILVLDLMLRVGAIG
jgi:hypothetical protein